jgi:cyanophycinase
MRLLRRKYLTEDFVLAGTSAGAMIMSESTIDEGDSDESLIKGMMNLSEGLGFLPGAIIDTHFLNRGRISRLVEALLLNRNCIGIGLCEDTAIVITEGNMIRPIGSGSVTIIQPFEIGATNFYHAKENEAVYVENLKFHILAKGMNYSVKEKKLYGLEMVPA